MLNIVHLAKVTQHKWGIMLAKFRAQRVQQLSVDCYYDHKRANNIDPNGTRPSMII